MVWLLEGGMVNGGCGLESRDGENVSIVSMAVKLESADTCCVPSGLVWTFGFLGLRPSVPR